MCARVIVVYTGNLSPIRNESHSWAIFGGKTREHLSRVTHILGRWAGPIGRIVKDELIRRREIVMDDII
jgi:hypothetical protein